MLLKLFSGPEAQQVSVEKKNAFAIILRQKFLLKGFERKLPCH